MNSSPDDLALKYCAAMGVPTEENLSLDNSCGPREHPACRPFAIDPDAIWVSEPESMITATLDDGKAPFPDHTNDSIKWIDENRQAGLLPIKAGNKKKSGTRKRNDSGVYKVVCDIVTEVEAKHENFVDTCEGLPIKVKKRRRKKTKPGRAKPRAAGGGKNEVKCRRNKN